MIIDDVATQANSLLIHHPDAITDFYIIYNIDIFMLSVSAFSDILIIDQVIGLGLALAMVHIQAGVFLAIFLYGRT